MADGSIVIDTEVNNKKAQAELNRLGNKIKDVYKRQEQIVDVEPTDGRYYISVDYGTLNPFSAGLWCVTNDRAVRINEYYYSGRGMSKQKTDEEYYEKLREDVYKRQVWI